MPAKKRKPNTRPRPKREPLTPEEARVLAELADKPEEYWAAEILASLPELEPKMLPARPLLETMEQAEARRQQAIWRSKCALTRSKNEGSALTVLWGVRLFDHHGKPGYARHLRNFLREHYPRQAEEHLGPEQETLDVG